MGEIRLSPEREQWITLLSDWPDDLTKHYTFMRYCLRAGGPWECFHMAHAMREQPLPVKAMRHIASRWDEPTP